MSDNPNNVYISHIKYKDNSEYKGQVYSLSNDQVVAYGYGLMLLNDKKFKLYGYFINGKAIEIKLTDPNGNISYAKYKSNNKRYGKALFIRNKDHKHFIETYDDNNGKLLKKNKENYHLIV